MMPAEPGPRRPAPATPPNAKTVARLAWLVVAVAAVALVWLYVGRFAGELLAGILASVVLLGALLAAVGKGWQRRYVALVASQGWTYRADDDGARAARFAGTLAMGEGMGVRDVVTGTCEGVSFEAFHTRSNDARTDVPGMAVVAVRAPRSAPDLRIFEEEAPQTFKQDLGLGDLADINFESDAFSRRFFVQCRQRRFAYDVITPAMMEWLLQRNRNHGRWQWIGDWLIHYNLGAFTGDHLVTAVQETVAFLRLLPRIATEPPAAA